MRSSFPRDSSGHICPINAIFVLHVFLRFQIMHAFIGAVISLPFQRCMSRFVTILNSPNDTWTRRSVLYTVPQMPKLIYGPVWRNSQGLFWGLKFNSRKLPFNEITLELFGSKSYLTFNALSQSLQSHYLSLTVVDPT